MRRRRESGLALRRAPPRPRLGLGPVAGRPGPITAPANVPARGCSRWRFAGAALAAFMASGPAPAGEAPWWMPEYTEAYGEIELEGTGFFEDPQFPGQDRDAASLSLEPTVLAEWMGGDLVFRFTPFARLDSADERRSHGDIRELKFDLIRGAWSVTFGVDRVFWGKTEVVHLVDIINQTDQVEDLDDEDRLGQPMLRVARLTELGEISAYVMPYFRERSFPGPDGRLRFAQPVATSAPIYETAAERWTPSFALRFSGFFGPVDLGLSAFHGLSRDPSFLSRGGQLSPVYSRITQAGLDAQYTVGPTLWKLEALWRRGQRDARFRRTGFAAATGGLEHTLFGVLETEADLGLIAEYAFDSRGENALTSFQNDLILGARLTLNDPQDTALLLTGAVDMEDGALALRLEGERRLSAQWSAELEAQGFVNQPSGPVLGAFAKDSFVRLKLTYFF